MMMSVTVSNFSTNDSSSSLPIPMPPPNHSHKNTVVTSIVFGLIGTFGIVGNSLVICIIEKLPRKHRAVSLYLICAQAVNDLVASFLIIPVTFCDIFDVLPPKNSPIVGNIYCRFIDSYSILFITFALSTYNLTIISYERYMAVFKPMDYKAKFTKAHSKKLVYSTWLIAPLSQMMLMIFQFNYDPREGVCFNNPSFGPTFQSLAGTFVFTLEYFIPVTAMGISYCGIIKRLRSQKKRIESWNNAAPNTVTSTRGRQASSHRVTITLLACSSVYLICWTPNQALFLHYNLGGDADFDSVFYSCTVLLVFLNSCRNPVVYAFRYRKYRDRLWHILTG